MQPQAGPPRLAEEGFFFVGGRKKTIASPFYGPTGLSGPGEITVAQMYVHYRVPAGASRLPVVLVHGSNHTGMTYETTPDGRQGWASYFAHNGHPVYVVDHVGRGRSGFDPTPISDAVARPAAAGLHPAPLYPQQAAWVNFRFGPRFGEPFPGLQFPLDAFDDYLAQLVPNAEDLAEGPNGERTVAALGALLERIGPAVLMVHSQSGLYGLEVVRRNAGAVRALVNVEGGCAPLSDDGVDALRSVPFLSLWGDFSAGAVGANGDARRNGAVDLVRRLNDAGGRATFCLLPDQGIFGNSHMMMLDRNNLEVADVVERWLASVLGG